ncbi:T9SS type A sorting domain-containing protein [Fulvivirga sediminis]|uniref:T9SS type A sorting domain-containing protein n=1 Tax=Fulvivirga sediminis TaxID=2803949 RepID=A0A937K1U9_9BACT|nr:T9SS type A sorting domain-containing protein [Fulvivirga sediminis]MBL3657087.1 T9SS type A sorting domain-containing protein [Fulvivirga sediminis]
MRLFLTLTCFLFLSSVCKSQYAYQIENDVKIRGLSMPWAGGINSAQYSNIDLNGDGKQDLVVFDRTGNKVNTFVYKEGRYVYEPEYAYYFPEKLDRWLLLRDFNCDGKPDLFTGDALGMRVYVNTTKEGEHLSWRLFNSRDPQPSPLLSQGFSSAVNLQVNTSDLPAIIDVDGDGDLDILVFRPSANSTIEYHRNMSMENNGNCDSLQMKRITQTWGGVKECGCGIFAFDGDDCGLSGGREEHQGGKAMFLYDRDGDGDLDLVMSEETCSGTYYFENKGDSQEAYFNEVETNFPNAEDPAWFYIFPSAHHADVDMDGLDDIMVSSNYSSNTTGRIDFSASSWYYKNTGDGYDLIQKDFLQDQMIDLGENAAPAFIDEDGDGDLDMIVGQFIDNTQGILTASLKLYENVETISEPAFELKNSDYLGLSQRGLFNFRPKFYDVNNDGNPDLVISATDVTNSTTSIYYMLNQSSSSFVGSGVLVQFFSLSGLGDYSENYEIADIDQDGRFDILVGRMTGRVEYYRNLGSWGNSSFTLENNAFYNLDYSTSRINPSIEIADLNADGKSDLLIGDQRGTLTIFDDFRNHLEDPEPGVTAFMRPRGEDYLTTFAFGSKTYPVVINLFNEDHPAIVVGTGQGGVNILRSTEAVEGRTNLYDLDIYPNPVIKSETATVNISSRYSGEAVILNMLGQAVSQKFSLRANVSSKVYIEHLAEGIYIIYVNGSKSISQKFIVVD